MRQNSSAPYNSASLYNDPRYIRTVHSNLQLGECKIMRLANFMFMFISHSRIRLMLSECTGLQCLSVFVGLAV